jgi:hypothetical protein
VTNGMFSKSLIVQMVAPNDFGCMPERDI